MDIYDKEVERLSKLSPFQIMEEWSIDPETGKATSPLFAFVSRDRSGYSKRRTPCGCLTQIAKGTFEAETKKLTDAIRADKRIPFGAFSITKASLPVFAEWQRRIDKELNRERLEPEVSESAVRAFESQYEAWRNEGTE